MRETEPEEDTIEQRPKLIFGMRAAGRRRLKRPPTHGAELQEELFGSLRPRRANLVVPALPAEDNTPEGLRALLQANAHYRRAPWPEPYHRTTHRIQLGDARNLSASVLLRMGRLQRDAIGLRAGPVADRRPIPAALLSGGWAA